MSQGQAGASEAAAPFTLDQAVGEYAGQRVLGPLSLQIVPGQRVALIGRSGVGKSTLLSLMQRTWRDRVALVPQALGLVDTLSVLHNVYIGQLDRHPFWYNLLSLARPFRREREAIGNTLSALGMQAWLAQRAGELSGGQRQRIAIARALYQQAGSARPLMLLADEPVSALDGALSETVMGLLVKHFSTAAIALHDVELALRYCDRIIGLQDGAIAVDRPSRELVASDLDWLY